MAEHDFSPEADARRYPPTVLIAEDDVLVRGVTADFLRLEGFQVLEAANVEEAKRLLAADAASIGFVVTDIHMPGGENGLDLVQHVRQSYPGLPVLVISGNPGPAGLNDVHFLAKPFQLDRLISIVKLLLFAQRDTDLKPI